MSQFLPNRTPQVDLRGHGTRLATGTQSTHPALSRQVSLRAPDSGAMCRQTDLALACCFLLRVPVVAVTLAGMLVAPRGGSTLILLALGAPVVLIQGTAPGLMEGPSQRVTTRQSQLQPTGNSRHSLGA